MPRLQKLLLLLFLAAVPAYFLISALRSDWSLARFSDEIVLREDGRVTDLDTALRARIPFELELEQLGLQLRLWGGAREYNGIFISEEGLMRNIDPPVQAYLDENVAQITAYARELSGFSFGQKNSYVAVVPTSVGVLTQNLPRFGQSQTIDQQRQIEEIYSALASTVHTVDVYSQLQNNRSDYIFNRTDHSMTALGGYYTYSTVGRQMGLSGRSRNQFDIEYVDHAFYGNLYQPQTGAVDRWANTAPYRAVRPDTLAVYRYRGNREYVVEKRTGSEKKTYHSLYPLQQLSLGYKTSIYLGGETAVTEIRSSTAGKGRLLVFGDQNAHLCLPLFANHYQQITFINLGYASAEEVARVYPQGYDQTLFLYGIESLIHSGQLGRLGDIDWDYLP